MARGRTKNDYATSRTQRELLQKLVEFALAKPQKGKRADREARRMLVHLLQRDNPFLHAGDIRHVLLGSAAAEIAPWTNADISRFRDSLAGFLKAVAERRTPDDVGALLPPPIELKHLKIEVAAAGKENRDVYLLIDGNPADVLWLQLLMLLRDVGFSRLRACDGCKRLFIKTGKRDYCSDTCRVRINVRRWRSPEARARREKIRAKRVRR